MISRNCNSESRSHISSRGSNFGCMATKSDRFRATPPGSVRCHSGAAGFLRARFMCSLPVFDAAIRSAIHVKARQIVRRARLTPSDLLDLEQDIALHVWQRLGRYDSAKADPGRFTRMLIGHAVATALRDHKRRMDRAPASLNAMLEHPDDRPLEPLDPGLSRREEDQARAFDVAAVLATLPPTLREVARALQTQSVTATARQLGLSRREIYRRLGALRRAFLQAGLEQLVQNPGDTSNSAGVVPL